MKNLARERATFSGIEWPKEEKYPKRLLWALAFASAPFVLWGAAVVLK